MMTPVNLRSNRSIHKCFVAVAFALQLCFTSQLAGYEIDGFTEPFREIEVAASEMGSLFEVHVNEGDRVQAGQVLADLNLQVLKASLQIAKSNMVAEGRLNSARAEFQMHRDRLAQMEGLRDRKHASQREVELNRTQFEIAEAKLQAVVEELKIKADEYERIKAQIEQRRVRSPIDGIVTRVFKDEGEFVSATDPVVAKVVQLNPLRIIFSVQTREAATIKESQLVRVSIGEDSPQVTRGIVEFVSPTADAKSGTRRVKIRVPNPDGKLQSGEPCTLLLDDSSNVAEADKKKTGSSKTRTLTVGTVE